MTKPNIKSTIIHRECIRNPSYKVIIVKEHTNDVWLFDNSEQELANSFYKRFVSKGLNVKLFERLWQEVKE